MLRAIFRLARRTRCAVISCASMRADVSRCAPTFRTSRLPSTIFRARRSPEGGQNPDGSRRQGHLLRLDATAGRRQPERTDRIGRRPRYPAHRWPRAGVSHATTISTAAASGRPRSRPRSRGTAARSKRMVPGNRHSPVFAYPLDGPVLSVKREVGKHFVACRGGGQAFNAGALDLNLLKACFLDARNNNQPHVVRQLIDQNNAARGWLIFATHDVTPQPSRYGCCPDFFEQVVRLRRGLRSARGADDEGVRGARDSTRNTPLQYVLITPARNEERYIGLTLESMVAPDPIRRCDGSSSATDRPIGPTTSSRNTSSAVDVDAISFECPSIGIGPSRPRSSASTPDSRELKAAALRRRSAASTPTSRSSRDYFEFLIAKFEENPRLGVAGTPFVESGRRTTTTASRTSSTSPVPARCSGAQCFEEIGGYIPIKGGGIDWTAVTTARMKGWQTRTFTEKTCVHHRVDGNRHRQPAWRLFRHGKKDYYLGGHPLWQVFRGAYQMTRRPYVDRRPGTAGGLLLGAAAPDGTADLSGTGPVPPGRADGASHGAHSASRTAG